MTENKNDSEPGRPSWAAGLDLSPEAYRPPIEHLSSGKHYPDGILRRLADAEMKVEEQERDLETLREVARACAEIHPNGRPEPDYLIDRDGDVWHPVGDDRWGGVGGLVSLTRNQVEQEYGPVIEAWKDGAPQRPEAVTHFGADSFGLLPQCNYDRTKNVRVAYTIDQVTCVDCLRKLASSKARGQRGEPDYLIDCDGDAWYRSGSGYAAFSDKTLSSGSRDRVEQMYGPVTGVWK